MMSKNNAQEKIILYGAPWCGPCVRVKFLFDMHQIPYDYINVDESEEASQKVIEINNGFRSIPTIIFPNGDTLTEPASEELVEKLRERGLLANSLEKN